MFLFIIVCQFVSSNKRFILYCKLSFHCCSLTIDRQNGVTLQALKLEIFYECI